MTTHEKLIRDWIKSDPSIPARVAMALGALLSEISKHPDEVRAAWDRGYKAHSPSGLSRRRR